MVLIYTCVSLEAIGLTWGLNGRRKGVPRPYKSNQLVKRGANFLLRGRGVRLSSLGSYPGDRWFKSNPRYQI